MREARHINLRGNRNLSDPAILELLKKVEELVSLDLHQIKLNTNLILSKIVETHPNIKDLTIDNVQRTDIKELLKLKNLSRLTILNAPTHSNTLGNGISIKGIIKLISEHPSLRKITLPNMNLFHQNLKNKKLKNKEYNLLTEALKKSNIRYYYFRSSFAINRKNMKILDGDTIRVIPPEHTLENRTNYRLYGVDTPEKMITKKRKQALQKYLEKTYPELSNEAVKTRVEQLAEYEARGGRAASAFTKHVLNKASKVRITHVKPGKFGGRIIAEIYLELEGQWFSLSKLLVLNNLAVEYYGDKKAIYDWSQVLDMNFVDTIIKNWI